MAEGNSTYLCRLIFSGCEFSQKHEARAWWELWREVSLPFVPRRGMRFSHALLLSLEDLCTRAVWSDEVPLEDDHSWGWKADLVVWNLSLGVFEIQFHQISLILPWESTPESLAEAFPGWTSTRKPTAAEKTQSATHE